MVKKKVPDWLNSSLWSSPSPPSDDHHNHHFSGATSSPTEASSAVSPSEPFPTHPPSPPVIADPPETQRIQDSRTNHDANDRNDTFTSSSSPSAHDISHQAQLLAKLSRKVIDIGELRRLACQGLPDGAGIRSTVWKLLLGYPPLDRSLWSSELAKKRSQYKHFKDILMNPSEITRRMYDSTTCDTNDAKCESRALLFRSEVTHGEHPLSLGETSIWNQFFQDTETVDQIDRDIKRTHPDMHFFSGDSQFAKYNQVNPQFYAFRWITLLLTQEFNFAESLHIWDTLLSDPDGPQETLLRICCAMLILIRRRLLVGDFTSNLKLLQNYPSTNINHLLYVANKLRVQSV